MPLVFIDETWAKTDMAPLRGWAPRGERLNAKVPYGHWNRISWWRWANYLESSGYRT